MRKTEKIVILSVIISTMIATMMCFGAVLADKVAVKHENSGQLLYVKGTRIAVPVGETVNVYTTVKAVGGSVSGSLEVHVRKDYQDVPDPADPYAVLTKTISLNNGETKEIYMGQFTASDLTGSGFGAFRQYFVKVYFNGENIYDPQDPNTRECVETYSTTSGQVNYQETQFAANEGHAI